MWMDKSNGDFSGSSNEDTTDLILKYNLYYASVSNFSKTSYDSSFLTRYNSDKFALGCCISVICDLFQWFKSPHENIFRKYSYLYSYLYILMSNSEPLHRHHRDLQEINITEKTVEANLAFLISGSKRKAARSCGNYKKHQY